MILSIDSDAAYLVAKKSRSRVAGYYHLSSDPKIKKDITLNGAIHTECKKYGVWYPPQQKLKSVDFS